MYSPLDVLVDARPDIEKNPNGNGYLIVHPELNLISLLKISKDNIEKVFSTILGEDIKLWMDNRMKGGERLVISSLHNGKIITPSLGALSTGQLALIEIFCTILKYADVDNLIASLALHQIEGVAVIDEIELHLHAELQREVLPKLIKLFPRIQFIITSHSPLFLLGMQEEFGDDGFDIYEMPDANKISTEQFSEFENAYRYFQNTNRYQKEIKDAINQHVAKTLIITEGSTDWRHMKAAQQYLAENDTEMAWLGDAEFEFLEYDPPNSNSDRIKLQMSSSELKSLAKENSKIRQSRKLIIIADRDVSDVVKELAGKESYKDWGNNVYSLCLPIPKHRKETPEICIEHYYQDEEIRRETVCEDGICRRIYLGYEFDTHGRSLEKNGKYCTNIKSCGENKIHIIDGNDNNKVYDALSEKDTNYALSKMNFANKVLAKEAPFDQMDFSSFKDLFSVIREILNKPLL